MLEEKLNRAIEVLKNGDIIVYPTDTQYALGADIFNGGSVKKVFKIKNRPYNNPLPIAVENYDDIMGLSCKNKYLKSICENFLPGPLTIVLYKKQKISNLLTGGKNKIAIRIPKNKIALKLLKRFGPLTVTSANIHGKIPKYAIKDIHSQFKDDIGFYLDYGILNNSPSTIIDLTYKKPVILREGSISLDEILAVV